MAIHDWSIGGRPADAHALREALALERQSRKKASALEYEQLEAERNARAVGTALRRQMRERGMTRVWLRVRPKATSGRRDGVRRCRRIETMAGLVVAKRSHRGTDGLSSFHFKWTSRGFGERRKHASRRYRHGEAVRHLRYILRDGAREIEGSGIVSNISLDPDTLAGVFSALEELESHGRDNANVYVSVVVSLPSELTAAQRESLLSRICMIVGREGLPHVGVLHAPDPDGDQRNNHAHIMLSLRPFRVEHDGSFAFAAGTAADLNDASFIKMMRSEIADLMNEAMMAAGHERRFTALSNQERGLPARSKQKGKSTPGRKHHERRRERTDLMAGERGYRHERIDAINDFQQELLAELVTPHIDRTAAIEATKAHRAKAIPVIPPAAEPAPSPPPPVARTQPVAAPETRPPRETQVIVPPSSGELQRLLARLGETHWPPLTRKNGRFVVGTGSRDLHDRALLDRLREVELEPAIQRQLAIEWDVMISALRERLASSDPFGRERVNDLSVAAMADKAAKAFYDRNRQDPDIIALVESAHAAAAQRNQEIERRRHEKALRDRQRKEKVEAAIAQIRAPATPGRISETERLPIRPLVAALEGPLSEGRLKLTIQDNRLHVEARNPELIETVEKLFGLAAGRTALLMLARTTAEFPSSIVHPFTATLPLLKGAPGADSVEEQIAPQPTGRGRA